MKCLIALDDEREGRRVVREFHGNYQGLIQWMVEAERAYGKAAMLPIEECVVVNECGYIFKDSTNQIKYIEDYGTDDEL